MRPLKLRMTAWGPYKDETEIDFEKVTGGGLYLICGPTGAGKTSIFDALAFALYGNVSGSIREKEGFRSDFAAAEIPTRVELLFSHKGRIYRVMRSPRYERPKKRGGGTVKEPETASLSLPDGRELTGNAEVGAYLIGLLGLTYQQFRQLSMIAQGEFMEILTASSKERTEILRSVFGTEICERFQQLLTAQVKKLYQEIQEQNHRLEEASALAAVNDEEWKGFTYLQRIDYLEKELAELAEQKRDLENQWKQAEKEFQTCILKANEGKQINSLFAEKDRFQEKQKELNAQAAEMEKLRLDLSLRSKAVYVRAYLDAEHALRKSQASYLEAERRSNEQKARYEALEEYYRRASAGLLARGLQEGEPCPVCGSLLHPVPAKLPKEAPTEEQLKREKNRNDILARELLQEHQKSAECYTAFQLAEADAKREALEYWQEEYKERLEVLAKEPEASRRQRERRLRKYDEELEQAARSLEALNKTLTGKKPVDIEELEAERRKKERQRRELLREREHFAAAERSFAGSLRSMREKLEKKEQLEAEYGMIADVEKITKGQNSLRLVSSSMCWQDTLKRFCRQPICAWIR